MGLVSTRPSRALGAQKLGTGRGRGVPGVSLENSLVLGRYRVLWLVDQKKLAKTYIARDEAEDAFGTPVLVKQFLHDLGDQESPGVRTLFDELTTLTHLRHTGVVSLLNYGVVEDHLVTASSHLPGAALPQLCEHFARRQRPFPPSPRSCHAARGTRDLGGSRALPSPPGGLHHESLAALRERAGSIAR